jgi:hypothetical protein
VTFKDLQKLVQSQAGPEQSQLLQRLKDKPFWIWGPKQHKQEDNKTKGDCCFNHIIGLPRKDGIEKSIFDYENAEENHGAYVYAAKPYEIFLCSGFWGRHSTTEGPTSYGATLIHEISHFYDAAGTEDVEYDAAPCRKLAIDNPSDAIKNADSYSHFIATVVEVPIMPSLVDFASNRCVNKPFSVRADLMPKLRISGKHTSLRQDIMSKL